MDEKLTAGGDCLRQVVPPSAVAQMVVPTAQPTVGDTNWIAPIDAKGPDAAGISGLPQRTGRVETVAAVVEEAAADEDGADEAAEVDEVLVDDALG